MDWIDEKFLQIRNRIHNMSLKHALMAYIVVFIIGTFILSYLTMNICNQWQRLIVGQSGQTDILKHTGNFYISYVDYSLLGKKERMFFSCLSGIKVWCPYVYAVLSMIFVSLQFYKRRLLKPIVILENGIEEIKKQNLDITVFYDSKDEMGKVCRSFDDMRLELLSGKKEMWRMVEEQKKLNAAFAHDLRTPLTVLRGYSDFLGRYLPQGKVSEEKLSETLFIMSGYIERLEHYTNTMKSIRSLDDWQISLSEKKLDVLLKEMKDVAEIMNKPGILSITLNKEDTGSKILWIDSWIFMEVFENLLSNAVRYADSQVWVTLRTEDGKLFVFVEDDGPGFTKEGLNKAEMPYYRGERSAEEKEHFGIGLHICGKLCERHGGSISVANRMEGGAIVSASFAILKTS